MLSELASRSLATLGLAALSLAAACFYDWDDRQPPASTSTTTSGGGASGGGTGTGSGSGGAPSSGCPACSDGFYCDYLDGLCGDGDPGSCQPPPPGGGERVCGCDGIAYASVGAAALAGVDFRATGHCSADCGDSVCDAVKQVCSTQPPAVPQCKDLSSTPCAQDPNPCACLEQADPACKCTIGEAGLIHLDC